MIVGCGPLTYSLPCSGRKSLGPYLLSALITLEWPFEANKLELCLLAPVLYQAPENVGYCSNAMCISVKRPILCRQMEFTYDMLVAWQRSKRTRTYSTHV